MPFGFLKMPRTYFNHNYNNIKNTCLFNGSLRDFSGIFIFVTFAIFWWPTFVMQFRKKQESRSHRVNNSVIMKKK